MKSVTKMAARNIPGSTVIVWFRCDFRVADNPALKAAIESGLKVIPLYIWAPDSEGQFGVSGTASEVWLAESLKDLSASLEKLGSTLIIRKGKGLLGYFEEILVIAKAFGSQAIYFNRRYEPNFKEIDADITKRLGTIAIESFSFCGSLLYEPTSVSLDSDKWHGHWGTLMPFFKACAALGPPPRPSAPPMSINSPSVTELLPYTLCVTNTGLAKMPVIKGNFNDWGAPIREAWPISEEAAQNELRKYVNEKLAFYEEKRSRTDTLFVSRLSPYLRWGQLSPQTLYWAVKGSGIPTEKLKTFSRRLFWRDLAYYQLHTFPDMTSMSIRKHYEDHSWSTNDAAFESWKTGTTGFPMVDAGMRELYTVGWIHQSVRMVCAGFLTEYLNQHWRRGHDWFIHTLVDADVAINAMMWQNAGRSGIDQWNFLSSPESGSQDPTGAYVRKWCPELRKLSNKLLHMPWKASISELASTGVVLGSNYPHRILVDLSASRQDTKMKVIEMRKNSMRFNDHYGYDLITLPHGGKVRVFTKV
jgi:deoxyribodipyrimidine photo-lyase